MPATEGKAPTRTLGRTGKEVSIVGLGLAGMFVKPFMDDPDGATELLRHAVADLGVFYFETSSNYKAQRDDGSEVFSEDLIGPAVERMRDQVLLVTKMDERDYDGCRRELERSLKRLRTDRLDVCHVHAMEPDEEAKLDEIERGAVRAIREAMDEGVVDAWGVTGHAGSQVLHEAVKRWDPDCILSLFHAGRPDFGRYEQELLPLCAERNMGVFAMKVLRTVIEARGAIEDAEPIATGVTIEDLIRYSLSLPGVCTAAIGTESTQQLDENARIARAFRPMDEAQRDGLHELVATEIEHQVPPWERPQYVDGVVAAA